MKLAIIIILCAVLAGCGEQGDDTAWTELEAPAGGFMAKSTPGCRLEQVELVREMACWGVKPIPGQHILAHYWWLPQEPEILFDDLQLHPNMYRVRFEIETPNPGAYLIVMEDYADSTRMQVQGINRADSLPDVRSDWTEWRDWEYWKRDTPRR